NIRTPARRRRDAPRATVSAHEMIALEPASTDTGSVIGPNFDRRKGMRIRQLLWSLVAVALVSLALVGPASGLAVGQTGPDYALNGADGKPVKLSDLTAKGPVVIYTFIAAITGA